MLPNSPSNGSEENLGNTEGLPQGQGNGRRKRNKTSPKKGESPSDKPKSKGASKGKKSPAKKNGKGKKSKGPKKAKNRGAKRSRFASWPAIRALLWSKYKSEYLGQYKDPNSEFFKLALHAYYHCREWGRKCTDEDIVEAFEQLRGDGREPEPLIIGKLHYSQTPLPFWEVAHIDFDMCSNYVWVYGDIVSEPFEFQIREYDGSFGYQRYFSEWVSWCNAYQRENGFMNSPTDIYFATDPVKYNEYKRRWEVRIFSCDAEGDANSFGYSPSGFDRPQWTFHQIRLWVWRNHKADFPKGSYRLKDGKFLKIVKQLYAEAKGLGGCTEEELETTYGILIGRKPKRGGASGKPARGKGSGKSLLGRVVKYLTNEERDTLGKYINKVLTANSKENKRLIDELVKCTDDECRNDLIKKLKELAEETDKLANKNRELTDYLRNKRISEENKSQKDKNSNNP